MKEIKLSGKWKLSVLVDDEDYEKLIKHKWTGRKDPNNMYAQTSIKGNNGKWKTQVMHRLILGIVDSKKLVDHIDHNGLNCQRSNLRIATASENMRNKRPLKNKKDSPFLGVMTCDKLGKNKDKKYYRVFFRINGKQKHSGSFPHTKEGEVLAAKRYDELATNAYGEFANLNFK